jgi:fumarate hydratase class I
LISKSIKKAKKIAFAEMGMEAIYEFEVKDMPVAVNLSILVDVVGPAGPITSPLTASTGPT